MSSLSEPIELNRANWTQSHCVRLSSVSELSRTQSIASGKPKQSKPKAIPSKQVFLVLFYYLPRNRNPIYKLSTAVKRTEQNQVVEAFTGHRETTSSQWRWSICPCPFVIQNPWPFSAIFFKTLVLTPDGLKLSIYYSCNDFLILLALVWCQINLTFICNGQIQPEISLSAVIKFLTYARLLSMFRDSMSKDVASACNTESRDLDAELC